MEFGEPFVMIPGMILMLVWCALKWDTLEEVEIYLLLSPNCL